MYLCKIILEAYEPLVQLFEKGVGENQNTTLFLNLRLRSLLCIGLGILHVQAMEF